MAIVRYEYYLWEEVGELSHCSVDRLFYFFGVDRLFYFGSGEGFPFRVHH